MDLTVWIQVYFHIFLHSNAKKKKPPSPYPASPYPPQPKVKGKMFQLAGDLLAMEKYGSIE